MQSKPPFNFVAYEGQCPRCGGDLDAPDDNLDRYCPACRITIKAAPVTFEVITDDE
jgi:hypothetical protein